MPIPNPIQPRVETENSKNQNLIVLLLVLPSKPSDNC